MQLLDLPASGALWAYYTRAQVRIEGEEASFAYSWGDKDIAFHTCRTCGCTTHWVGLHATAHLPSGRMGVNARMLDPGVIAWAPIHRLDGADTWKPLGKPLRRPLAEGN
ncbi:MAG TPA: hypothetical protein VGS12_02355 [Caulobacteraceae bacterium]|nr:hypothetical protein [Caulobacteraceae bacterium]